MAWAWRVGRKVNTAFRGLNNHQWCVENLFLQVVAICHYTARSHQRENLPVNHSHFGLVDNNEEGFCGVINIQKGVSLGKNAYQFVIHHRHAWLRSRPRPLQENWEIVEGEFVLHERGKLGIVFKSEQWHTWLQIKSCSGELLPDEIETGLIDSHSFSSN